MYTISVDWLSCFSFSIVIQWKNIYIWLINSFQVFHHIREVLIGMFQLGAEMVRSQSPQKQ